MLERGVQRDLDHPVGAAAGWTAVRRNGALDPLRDQLGEAWEQGTHVHGELVRDSIEREIHEPSLLAVCSPSQCWCLFLPTAREGVNRRTVTSW